MGVSSQSKGLSHLLLLLLLLSTPTLLVLWKPQSMKATDAAQLRYSVALSNPRVQLDKELSYALLRSCQCLRGAARCKRARV